MADESECRAALRELLAALRQAVQDGGDTLVDPVETWALPTPTTPPGWEYDPERWPGADRLYRALRRAEAALGVNDG